jgi:hypothetical protein
VGELLYFTVLRIDSHEKVGDRLKVKGHFARTGIQEYGDGMGGIVKEYRSPGEVFSDASLASFRGVPVTLRHPKGVGGMVTADNWAELAGKGVVVGHLGDDPHRADDGRHAEASIWLNDADAIGQVQSGELTELSAGYTARVNQTPGTDPATGEHFDGSQEGIRGNHVALLGAGEARGGPSVRILDSEDRCIFDGRDGPPRRPEEQGMKFTIRVDGVDYEIEAPTKAVAQAIEKERQAHADALKKERTEKSELQAKHDAEVEAHGKTKAELDAAKVELAKPVREKLLADAKELAGKDIEVNGTDGKPKTDEAIQREALDAAGVKASLEKRGIKLDDKDANYVAVMFDSALANKPDPRTDSVSEARPGLFTQPEVVKADDLKDDERLHLTVADAQKALG